MKIPLPLYLAYSAWAALLVAVLEFGQDVVHGFAGFPGEPLGPFFSVAQTVGELRFRHLHRFIIEDDRLTRPIRPIRIIGIETQKPLLEITELETRGGSGSWLADRRSSGRRRRRRIPKARIRAEKRRARSRMNDRVAAAITKERAAMGTKAIVELRRHYQRSSCCQGNQSYSCCCCQWEREQQQRQRQRKNRPSGAGEE